MKNGTADSVSLADGYQIPSISLKNVEVRNLLYDYQALIYVENDNFILTGEAVQRQEVVHHFGDPTVEASIEIQSSRFIDSSFDLGMIYIPPTQKFVDFAK